MRPAQGMQDGVDRASPVVLILIDVINDMEFEGGERLLERALPMARALARLKRRRRGAGIPSIYVNDHFGKWREDRRAIVSHCLDGPVRGHPVAKLLKPDEEDYFVIESKHSGFFSTTLDALLTSLRARTLIIGGMATDICVLFTANDAYMRDYRVLVPGDCVAAETSERSRRALAHMRKTLKADTGTSKALRLPARVRSPKGRVAGAPVAVPPKAQRARSG